MRNGVPVPPDGSRTVLRQDRWFCAAACLAIGVPALMLQGQSNAQEQSDPKAKKPAVSAEKRPTTQPSGSDGQFARNAFPPPLPDTDLHTDAWGRKDCLLCHTWNVMEAPYVRHEGMPKILLTANCRTCHVMIKDADAGEEGGTKFMRNAFPPTLPDDKDHADPWLKKGCMDCHEAGKDDAQAVRHDGMSDVLLKASCRTCHVMIRTRDVAGKPE